jgi:hypothetical protein
MHHQKLKILDIVDKELLESIRQIMAGLLV